MWMLSGSSVRALHKMHKWRASDAKLRNELIFDFLAISAIPFISISFRSADERKRSDFHRLTERSIAIFEEKRKVSGRIVTFALFSNWMAFAVGSDGNQIQHHARCMWSARMCMCRCNRNCFVVFCTSENILYVSFHTTPPEGPLVHDVLTLFNHIRKENKKKKTKTEQKMEKMYVKTKCEHMHREPEPIDSMKRAAAMASAAAAIL